MNNTDELAPLLDALTQTASTADTETGAPASTEPRVLFRSALELTREQEDTLIAHCEDRVAAMASAMGRSQATTGEARSAGCLFHRDSWIGQRERYTKFVGNDVEWRARELQGVFADYNCPTNTLRHRVRQAQSRATNYYFRLSPWFACRGIGVEDADTSDIVQKYARTRLEDTKEEITQALNAAFIRGESVLKTYFYERRDTFETVADVLISPETGEPVVQENGDYVMLNSREGREAQESGGVFMRKKVWRTRVQKRTPRHELLHYADFLFPLTAPSLDEADAVAHLYDLPAHDIVGRFLDAVEGLDSADRLRITARALELLGATRETPMAVRSQPVTERGESSTSSPGNLVPIVECWCNYDVRGDGVPANLAVYYHRETLQPIFYDYVQNVTPDGERPFTMFRCLPVEYRPYGQGYVELFFYTALAIDQKFNLGTLHSSEAGRVDFFDPSATLEGQANPGLKMGWGRAYRLAPGKTSADALSSVVLPEVKMDDLMRQIEFLMQGMQGESGTVGPTDAGMGGMASQKLATGIRYLDRMNEEISNQCLQSLDPAVNKSLVRSVILLFANLKEEEAFRFTQPDSVDPQTGAITPGATTLLSIAPEDARDIELDIEVMMSSYSSEQTMAAALEVINLIDSFYAKSYIVQLHSRRSFIRVARQLGETDAETLFQPVPPPAPETQPGTPGAPTQADASAIPKATLAVGPKLG